MMQTIKLENKILEELIQKSRESERKRALHIVQSSENGEVPAIIFNVLQPGTYVQPHMHPCDDGREIWIPNRGLLKAVIFDENGKITESYNISDSLISGISFLEIPSKTYHSVIAFEPDSVLCELYMGIYKAETYKRFANWAPSEKDLKSKEYLESLIRNIQ